LVDGATLTILGAIVSGAVAGGIFAGTIKADLRWLKEAIGVNRSSIEALPCHKSKNQCED
jgi:hypothetical protein